jgi:hypothetical protein
LYLEAQYFCEINLTLFLGKERVMTSKRKTEIEKKKEIRYNEFMRYLQKRMKELARDEKKFRDAIMKERKIN